MITIIDYGMGNLGSVKNMFKRIGVESVVSSDISEISRADKILLPGVGAFDAAMRKIKESGFINILNEKALIQQIPIMGICLGMQLLTNKSEEGSLQGLGWIDAETVKFHFDKDSSNKIPHMGWNVINRKKDSVLTKNLPIDSRFYFVHSYYVKCNDQNDIVCTTPYGHDFTSILQRGNIFGAQFHPEKSLKFGMEILSNFSKV